MSVWLSSEFLHSVLRIATPLLYASLAALLCQRVGLFNLGLEGSLLFAALFGVLGSAYGQSWVIGLMSAIVASVILHALFAFFVLHQRLNPTLIGVAINLVAAGGSALLLFRLTGQRGLSSTLVSQTVPALSAEWLQKILGIGSYLNGHNSLTLLALVLVPALNLWLRRSNWGLRSRAVGENPETAFTLGLRVKRLRWGALMLSALLCGLGGAYLSMGYLSWYTQDMVAGRGFVALALSTMGGGNPGLTAVFVLFFALLDSLGNHLQSLRVPAEFVQMLPYALTSLGLLVYAEINKRKKRHRDKGGA